MKWNWEQKGWPEFVFDTSVMKHFEERFLSESGILFGAIKHLDEEGMCKLRIEILSDESLKTSEIEGEYLNRASIQSSIRRHFGLQHDRNLSRPFEHGIAEMMTDVYENYAELLSCKTICEWQKLICAGRNDLESGGGYRTHEEQMRIVSGSLDAPKVHFVAPPSKVVPAEMARFINWFNKISSTGQSTLSALTRSGITHLYFVSIHPFEDDNGRIARALAEKSLAQAIGHPTLIALAQIINDRRKKYYDNLANNSRKLEITEWLTFFAQTVLDAQSYTLQLIEFVIAKNKFFARFDTQLNSRQKKVLLRMFEAGPDGFEGGLSAANYRHICKTASATTTRDLADLTVKGALSRIGKRKSTRYFLNLTSN